jgi:hypothetical protein
MRDPMIEFVHQALKQGLSREQITQALKGGGWSPEEIQTGLDAYVDAGLPIPVPRKRASTSPKEAFLFLVLFCSLYTWMFALGSLCFDLLNLALAQPGEVPGHGISSLRAGMAAVMVAFPLFLFMQWLAREEALRNPGQRISPIRRWLTYLTLFGAAVAIVSDLITLGIMFLEGEVTLRFLLKVLVVALLAGSAFIYYLRQLKQEEREPSPATVSRRVIWVPLLTCAVLAVLGVAFWNAGSPLKARLYRLDQERVRDLKAIEERVQHYYQAKDVLPPDLAACDVMPGLFVEHKKDPVTGDPYRYRVVDATHVEIGATFALPSSNTWGDEGFWKHGAGKADFRVEARKEK